MYLSQCNRCNRLLAIGIIGIDQLEYSLTRCNNKNRDVTREWNKHFTKCYGENFRTREHFKAENCFYIYKDKKQKCIRRSKLQ